MSVTMQIVPDGIEHVAETALGHVEQALGAHRAQAASNELFHLVLTGGRAGTVLTNAMAAWAETENVDFSDVHVWWGDERWTPGDSTQRNDEPVADALKQLASRGAIIHPMCPDGAFDSPEAAADAYAAELAALAKGGPHLTFLGVGEDAHVASLFPGHNMDSAEFVIAVHNSPKQPPTRISMSLRQLSSSEQVVLLASGGDKANAVRMTLAGENVPAARVLGQRETVLIADASAAQN